MDQMPLATEIKSAHEAGTKWAQGLKIGDVFIGASPEAEQRYTHSLTQRVFMFAALDVLDHCELRTDSNGIITSFVNHSEK